MAFRARILAYLAVLGAVLAVLFKVIWAYDSLPAQIPLSRWTDTATTPFMVLRVPLINLASLGLIEVLLRPLRRCEGFGNALVVATSLYLTVATKSLLEGMGLLLLPHPIDWTLAPLMATLAVGLGIAAFQGRSLWQNGLWRSLRMTKGENAVFILLLVSILGLNGPLLMK